MYTFLHYTYCMQAYIKYVYTQIHSCTYKVISNTATRILIHITSWEWAWWSWTGGRIWRYDWRSCAVASTSHVTYAVSAVALELCVCQHVFFYSADCGLLDLRISHLQIFLWGYVKEHAYKKKSRLPWWTKTKHLGLCLQCYDKNST